MSWEVLRRGIDLQEYYARSPGAERLPALLQAIRCFHSILEVSAGEVQPAVLKASASLLLGTAYSELPDGDRTENLRRAIACWETCLQIYTEQEFPFEWGAAHRQLGTGYLGIRAGAREDNLKTAIRHYEAALRVTSENNSPEDWAEIQNNLGIAYEALPDSGLEEKTSNLEHAMACFHAALRVRTFQDWPNEWARLQRNLGSALRDLPSGDPTDNLERAIEHSHAAMRVFTYENFPTEFALTQFGLAAAYRKLWAGDRAENLKRAISCLEIAHQVHPDWGVPPGWSAAQYDLGNLYLTMVGADSAGNRAKAIACLTAALSAEDEHKSPESWARIHNTLGVAYCDLQTGDREENIRRAIGHYQAALRVWSEHEAPEDWAKVQTNLGNAFRALPEGDPAENLQRAVGCYEAALRIYSEESSPVGWAQAKSNLGLVYSELPFGDPKENLQFAVACHQAALRVFTERDYPDDWAHAQLNLGYTRMKAAEWEGNLEAAIESYESAARIYNEHQFATQWAAIQNGLGVAYLKLSDERRAESFTRAIACFEAALRVRTEHFFPIDFATTQQNLGRAYSYLPTGERMENLDCAIACYRAALRVCTSDVAPEECRQTLTNLNEDLFSRNDWLAVLETTRELLALQANHCALAADHSALQRAAGKSWPSLGRGAIAATRLGDFEAAFRLSAQAKSQNLAAEMVRGDAQPKRVSREDWGDYRALLARRCALAAAYGGLLRLPVERRSSGEQLALLQQIRQLDRDRLATESRFAGTDPDYAPLAMHVDLPRCGQITAQCQAVLVDFRVTLEGMYIFLVGPGEETIGADQCISQPLGAGGLTSLIQHWLWNYYRDYTEWRQDLDASIGLLYRPILSALHARLRDRYPQIQRLVLIPDLGLHLLPLHAAAYHEDGKRRYFCDDYEITYAPSMQVLDRCMARQATHLGRAQSLVALENPSLAFAEWELREAERHFAPDHCRRFGPAGIDKQAVAEALSSAEHLLFTTHGMFAPNDADGSGLELDRSRGEYLTAREVVGLDLRRTRLAILSACESGMSEFADPANEYLGLPAAFLLAGAHSVIASQWVVDDLSTALLMSRLHENVYDRGMGAAAALRSAQRWLRTLTASTVLDLLKFKEHSGDEERLRFLSADGRETPFADPYYWAAFFVFGAPGATEHSAVAN